MRILRIVDSMNPEAGGIVEAITQTALALKRIGCETDVLCLDPVEAAWLAQSKVVVYAVGKGLSKYGYQPQLKKWLLAYAVNYDHIIIDGIWHYHSYATRNVCRKLDLGYSIYTHGMLDPWFKQKYPLKHLKKWLFWPWSDYLVLRDAKNVLFTCQEELELAAKSFWLYKVKACVAPIGTSSPALDKKYCSDAFLHKFSECRGKRNFLFLSRIHEKKGCDLLIQAFAKVAKGSPELHLIMAGPDPTGWSDELKKMARNLSISHKITWTGMLRSEMKYGAYHCAEAFVLPSHQENFGIVVAEALACATPVLISNKVNIWREIIEDKAGLVEDDSLAGVTTLLEQWLRKNAKQRNKISQNALQCFHTRFEIKKATDSLINILSIKEAEIRPI